jgi:hypothetical protein
VVLRGGVTVVVLQWRYSGVIFPLLSLPPIVTVMVL